VFSDNLRAYLDGRPLTNVIEWPGLLINRMEKTSMAILVIHGAGMNMRGKVQTEVFGTLTLPDTT